jgi:hypothetical protein
MTFVTVMAGIRSTRAARPLTMDGWMGWLGLVVRIAAATYPPVVTACRMLMWASVDLTLFCVCGRRWRLKRVDSNSYLNARGAACLNSVDRSLEISTSFFYDFETSIRQQSESAG